MLSFQTGCCSADLSLPERQSVPAGGQRQQDQGDGHEHPEGGRRARALRRPDPVPPPRGPQRVSRLPRLRGNHCEIEKVLLNYVTRICHIRHMTIRTLFKLD